MTFSERVERITVPLGFASDRLHKELGQLMEQVYLEGLACGFYPPPENPGIQDITAKVRKDKRSVLAVLGEPKP